MFLISTSKVILANWLPCDVMYRVISHSGLISFRKKRQWLIAYILVNLWNHCEFQDVYIIPSKLLLYSYILKSSLRLRCIDEAYSWYYLRFNISIFHSQSLRYHLSVSIVFWNVCPNPLKRVNEQTMSPLIVHIARITMRYVSKSRLLVTVVTIFSFLARIQWCSVVIWSGCLPFFKRANGVHFTLP